MEKDQTPKPCKKNPKSRAPTESDDDLPAPPKRAVRPALIDEGDDSEKDLPPKEGAKKNKGKGKEIQEPDRKGKATNKGADQTRDGNVPKPKRSVLPIILLYPHPSCHMSLLSLNETTLYYYFLSDRISSEEKLSTGINRWVATIPDNAKPGNKVASASALRMSNHSGSHIPALTNATSRSSNTSVLSESIKISQNVDAKVKTHAEPHDASLEIIELGLEDDDETMGIEREAALKSPPKGKVRVSSDVTKHFFTRSPPFTVY